MKKLERWDVEDPAFWDGEGKKIANRNLWVSIPNLLCGFSVWLYWGMIAKTMQALHFGNTELFNFTFGNDGQPLGGDAYRALLFNLPAVAGLAGATLRIPNSFMIALCGGRNVKFMTTLLLILPAIAAGFALQNPDTPFLTFVVLAAMSGVGGGAFASSMSNISFFFPKRMQGLALGLNAGLGNAGVSVMQFLIPWAITFGMFGALGGDGYDLVKGGATRTLWIQNAALVWVPIMAVCLIGAFFFMNNLPQHNKGGTNIGGAIKYLWLTVLGFAGAAVAIALLLLDWGAFPNLLKILIIVTIAVVSTLALMKFATPADTKENLKGQFAIFRNKHNWVMTWLYTMTFGSFIGYANAFPKLIDDVFGVIRVGADGNTLPEAIINPNAPVASNYIWIGAAVGRAHPPGGRLALRQVGRRARDAVGHLHHGGGHDRSRLLRLEGEPVDHAGRVLHALPAALHPALRDHGYRQRLDLPDDPDHLREGAGRPGPGMDLGDRGVRRLFDSQGVRRADQGGPRPSTRSMASRATTPVASS